MAVVTTDLGPNSAFVAYTSGETVANCFAAINNWLQFHGWEIFDVAPGPTAIVYRAICKNLTQFKFVMVGYNASGIYMRIYENWNASTKVGTNETAYGNTTSFRIQRFDATNGGYYYLFATNRYMVIYARTLGGAWGATSGNSWSGCFEFSQDVRDTRNIPRFGFADGTGMLGNYAESRWGTPSGSGSTNGTASGAENNWLSAWNGYSCFCVPRTTDGLVGTNAERFMNVGCSFGLTLTQLSTIGLYQGLNSNNNTYGWGAFHPVGSTLTTRAPSGAPTSPSSSVTTVMTSTRTAYATGNIVLPLESMLPSSNSVITSTPWALTPWVYEMGSSLETVSIVQEARGRIYGIKIVQPGTGVFMDTVTIALDNDGFQDINGVPSTHHIINSGNTTRRFALPA